MTLTLFFHPFASYCQKVLLALYENQTPFQGELVDLSNEASRSAFLKLWPIGKFPVLRDSARGRLIPESSIIIDYLAQYFPGSVELVPRDPDRAREARLMDRFFDCHVADPMAKIVTDRLRPSGQHDAFGVEQAKASLLTAYGIIERDLAQRTWAIGESFSMADCAAAPALFYADLVLPLTEAYPLTKAYLSRLVARPTMARVLEEAAPYFKFFPR
jgi:glutathione S-transferase